MGTYGLFLTNLTAPTHIGEVGGPIVLLRLWRLTVQTDLAVSRHYLNVCFLFGGKARYIQLRSYGTLI